VLKSNIFLATWDVAEGALESDPVPLTTDESLLANQNEHPAWCGSDRIVWSRYNNMEEGGDKLEFTICTKALHPPGEEPNCHDTPADDAVDGGDELSERHPSCGVSNGQLSIAYAKQKTDSEQYGGTSRVCVVDFDFADDPLCMPDSHPGVDLTRPTWSPGGLVIAFASNELPPGDYDIRLINVEDLEDGGPSVPLGPNDVFEDNEPDWAPALLSVP
jgi:hypothetical protein